jgi:predicted 3-demethylubiquinone-9 3-methyltransferase (glyoxalase superfamily)
MTSIQKDKIVTNLWFDDQAEEAARYYTSIFENSKMGKISRYGKEGQEITKKSPGSVMLVEFWIEDQKFTALNGGPLFKFNESISLVVNCETQQEIDRYWDKLSAGGDKNAQQCGWLKDKYGLSWQIVPTIMGDLLTDLAKEKSERVMKALLQMKKLDIAALKKAFEGTEQAKKPSYA